MLGKVTVQPVLAVSDLETAKQFYKNELGLELVQDTGGGLLFSSGQGTLFLYESDYAGTNKATAANWEVADVPGMVQELEDRGVDFEHYDNMPGVERQGAVHTMGSMQAAWFKDPDGNILNISNNM